MENIYNYAEYVKCGEILRPPVESYLRPYALKCFDCKGIYLLFEAFIFHIEDHCRKAKTKGAPDSVDTQTCVNSIQEQKYLAVNKCATKSDIQEKDFPCVQTVSSIDTKRDISEHCENSLDTEEFDPPNNRQIESFQRQNKLPSVHDCQLGDNMIRKNCIQEYVFGNCKERPELQSTEGCQIDDSINEKNCLQENVFGNNKDAVITMSNNDNNSLEYISTKIELSKTNNAVENVCKNDKVKSHSYDKIIKPPDNKKSKTAYTISDDDVASNPTIMEMELAKSVYDDKSNHEEDVYEIYMDEFNNTLSDRVNK